MSVEHKLNRHLGGDQDEPLRDRLLRVERDLRETKALVTLIAVHLGVVIPEDPSLGVHAEKNGGM